MSLLVLGVEILLVALFVTYMSYFFGNWWRQHVAVTLASFLAWYLSMLIISVLPLDVSITYFIRCWHDNPSSVNTSGQTDSLNLSSQLDSGSFAHRLCRSPWISIDPTILSYFWHVVYWTSQSLTWLVLPIMQSYAKAGDFTVLSKLRSAVIDNAVYYGTYLVIFIVIFIYLLVKRAISFNLASLKVLVITASNTWGLFLVIVFLGYGLVEVPRSLWSAGCPDTRLRWAYFQLAKRNMERVEDLEELEDLSREVKKLEATMPPTHPLQSCLMIIVAKLSQVPLDSGRRELKRAEGGDEDEHTTDGQLRVSLKSMVKLHTQLKKAQHRYCRAEALWVEAVNQAAWLEDVENNRGSRLREFRRGTFLPSGEEEETVCCGASAPCGSLRPPTFLADCWASVGPQLEWYGKCLLRPALLKCIAVFLAFVSLAVVWSECTFWVHQPTLSLFALLLEMAAWNYNYLFVAMVSLTTIGYLSFCVYFTVFRLRIFNYYRLVPNHHTDENSLIFSGMLLCRLTPPLCLNFLGLVHLDSHVTQGANIVNETAYTRFMGHLDVIPFIASGFNVYFPMLVLVLCLVTYFRLGSRLLHCMGVQQFVEGGDITQETVEEGRILLRRGELS